MYLCVEVADAEKTIYHKRITKNNTKVTKMKLWMGFMLEDMFIDALFSALLVSLVLAF